LVSRLLARVLDADGRSVDADDLSALARKGEAVAPVTTADVHDMSRQVLALLKRFKERRCGRDVMAGVEVRPVDLLGDVSW
jgi:hypothetical protein